MHWIGFDVGKAFHWICVLDGEGKVILSRRVDATEEQLEDALSEIAAFGTTEERMVGIDIVGGPATLLEVLLLAKCEQVRYLPGTAVNRARDAYVGGERKSDPADAYVIADQLRLRWRSLTEVPPRDEDLEEVKVLVSHRADLVQERVRRISRLRGLLAEVFPGMEATLDLRKQGPLLAATKVATPKAARRLGKARLARWLKVRGALKSSSLAERIVDAAKRQRHETPAAEVKAALVAEISSEILRIGRRLDEIDSRLEELLADLAVREPRSSHPGDLRSCGVSSCSALGAEAGVVTPALRSSLLARSVQDETPSASNASRAARSDVRDSLTRCWRRSQDR